MRKAERKNLILDQRQTQTERGFRVETTDNDIHSFRGDFYSYQVAGERLIVWKPAKEFMSFDLFNVRSVRFL